MPMPTLPSVPVFPANRQSAVHLILNVVLSLVLLILILRMQRIAVQILIAPLQIAVKTTNNVVVTLASQGQLLRLMLLLHVWLKLARTQSVVLIFLIVIRGHV